MIEGLIRLVRGYSDEIRNGRTLLNIAEHMRGEVVELDDEFLKIAQGEDAGADGVIGETVDIMTCGIDFLVVLDPAVPDAEWAARIEEVTETVTANRKRRADRPGGTNCAGNDGFLEAIRQWTDELVDDSSGSRSGDASARIAIRAIAHCLLVLKAEAARLSDRELLDLSRTKLEKWKVYYSDSVHRVR